MSIRKVLVVDDSAPHLELLCNIVNQSGRQAITADCGSKAVTMAQSEQPDLILLDIVMDDLDGYGACREIVKNPDTSHIPVIFVSSKRQRADHIWAIKQGAKELISKPFQDQEILDVLDKY